ncbi:hypothetical protein [Hydrogenivirga sp. 128-5-R1-1]|uniref:hypothetical protein n=1 Tax=Hydrogenivirga sp. 128-5-R1-1 TaxID=392423 RepID=UPI00015F0DA7|nr:hypothetical protein [Hydrogenivirga sp. 128-5-R1-1]EDP72968.1 hypothetical protein HG1285_09356 [Hydrogenivirga sp. 128-5-R1-1]
MYRIIIFFIFIFTVNTFAQGKKQKITKEQFCHFSYGIYQQCYQRGLIPGIDCGFLSEGIRFGKGFSKSQIKYIQKACKMGCFLGKNKFKLKNENQFVSSCLKE